jgi:arsenate reductase-like glutaredoxin family protein
LRFFKERRVPVSLVDIGARPPAPTELRRFSQRFGASALLDSEAPAYRDGGLAYLRMDEDEVFERLLAIPGLLRLPLARCGPEVSIGVDEAAWKGWLSAPQGRAG